MATTTNYGWTTPDDTDLVKDGASAIRTLGSSIDTTLKAQIDAQIPDSIVDAKGDLISATADNTPARLASSAVNGDVLTVDTSTATGLKWAAPAGGTTTWTQRITQSTGRFNTIAYNGSNLYVAAGQSGVLYTSSDGITWTSRTSGFGANDILKVVFANSIWVAVGYQGVITTSTDGITWTARTANMGTNNIYDVIYENSTWVAVGEGGGTTNTGGLTYSTDAITWTRKSQTLTVGAVYKSIVWNGTNYIIGANNSTNNILTASTASGTWTARSSGSGQAINYIAWDGTRHYYVTNTGGSSRWWYSTTTTMTSSSDLTVRAKQVSESQHYFYSGGRIYGLGCFVQNFKMESGLPSSQGDIGLSPTNEINASGLNDNSAAIWFGTAGYIVSDVNGRLWTSF